MMRRITATVLLAAAISTLFCTGGCVVGFKPASETILTLRPADPNNHADPVTFGIADVTWEQFQHGYGVSGFSQHPRDHEAYSFLGYDPYMNSPGNRWDDSRRIAITPLGSAPEGKNTYHLELSIISPRLMPDRGTWQCAVSIGPPVRKDDILRFDLMNVPVKGPWPEPMVLSGRVVAKKGVERQF